MTSALKFFLGLAICFLLRLIPGRPPNVEPITATLMPFSKRFGWSGGVLFAFLSIVLFDAFSDSGIGTWTWVTAAMYALLGGLAGPMLKGRKGPIPYVIYAIFATLLFDAVTGPVMGAIIYDVPWREAIVGQIPFTINHLLGNIVLAAVLSPLVERWVTENPSLRTHSLAKA